MTPTSNILKYSIRHVRRPQMKNSENRQQLKLKNINNNIFKKFKNSKIYPKTLKKQHLKNNEGRPQMKIFKKWVIVQIINDRSDIFEN